MFGYNIWFSSQTVYLHVLGTREGYWIILELRCSYQALVRRSFLLHSPVQITPLLSDCCILYLLVNVCWYLNFNADRLFCSSIMKLIPILYFPICFWFTKLLSISHPELWLQKYTFMLEKGNRLDFIWRDIETHLLTSVKDTFIFKQL